MTELPNLPATRTVGLAMQAPPKFRDRAIAPAYLSLREGMRRFVSARVHRDQVEDVVQDILLRMHEHAGELRDDTRLGGWAFRIVRSVVADHHRARQIALPLSPSDAPEDAAAVDDDDTNESNVNEIVARWLHPMLELLPSEYGQAVELVDVQGKNLRELAEHAGLSLSGAKSRVQRGRRLLKEIVKMCCDLELDARGNVIAYTRRLCGRDV